MAKYEGETIELILLKLEQEIWMLNGNIPLYKKKNGRSIMLRLNKKEEKNYPDIPAEVNCYLTLDKNQKGY
ncbi:hypothetical protein Glove_26g82 [Diversispora epigaea]|uniref:Uncharacterized protein n=1 Tax=Diversispora epigaea TaxID=1348612 RepID=A0A397JJJ5_9GLOM|nr:hypothetical protein Glove_26g82 [Diversispora epigaea]